MQTANPARIVIAEGKAHLRHGRQSVYVRRCESDCRVRRLISYNMSGRRGDTDSPWRGRQRLNARCRQSHRQLRMFIEPEDRHPPFSRYGRIALSRNEKSGRGSLSFQWRIFEFLSVVPRPLFATAETRDHDEDPQRGKYRQFLHDRIRTKYDSAFLVAITIS